MLLVKGKLTIKNATLVGSDGFGLVALGKGTVLNLESVKMQNAGRCLDVMSGATVNIGKNTSLETTAGNCTVFVTSDDIAKAKLNVNGTVKCSIENYAISGNGTDKIGSDVVINEGAVVTSAQDSAIYQPQGGTLVINGGTIEGKDGIYQKSGKITVNGGTIKGNGNAEYKYNGNGSHAMGHGIVVEFANYPAGLPKLTTVGGTIISEQKADAIGYAVSPKYTGGKDLETLKAENVVVGEGTVLTGKVQEQ